MLIFDLESDGLLDTITQVWCIGILDTDNEQYTAYYGPSLGHALERLQEADVICGHNVIDYDIPALAKLYPGFKPKGKVLDTVIMARLLWPDMLGGHSLSAWGERLKFPKGDHSDWTQLSPEMLAYMEQDVRVTWKLFRACRKKWANHDWSASMRLEHRFQEYLSLQRDTGWPFNRAGAESLLHTMETRLCEIDDELNTLVPPAIINYDSVIPLKKDGDVAARATNWIYKDMEVLPAHHSIGGAFSKVEAKRPDYGSRAQMQELLLTYGWKPTEYTEKGNPKLNEESLKSVDHPIGQLLADRFVLVVRSALLRSWLSACRSDDRIESQAIGQGTPTGRARHRIIVNVPTGRAPWGKEIRQLFCTIPDHKLIGIDASGLELRMLAHYMKDRDYIDQILNGDIHTYNQELAGLPTRDNAKTFIYALLYGAGDAKIGSIIGGGAQDGAIIRAKFMRGLPKYKQLIDWVKAHAERHKWVPGLDGRKVFVRSEHAALNCLLQSAGSITVKYWTMRVWQLCEHHGIPVQFVGHFHDEINALVRDGFHQQYIDINKRSMTWAQEALGISMQLDVDANIGDNWAEVH